MCQSCDKENKWGGRACVWAGWCLTAAVQPHYDDAICRKWQRRALVTNTRSPEPPSSALLNFMKGLAVQFTRPPAEDARTPGNAAPLHQMRLRRTKSFTPLHPPIPLPLDCSSEEVGGGGCCGGGGGVTLRLGAQKTFS